MQSTLFGERTLTELDVVRLSKLLNGELASLLSRAEVLGSREVPADTITMNSQVELEDAHTGRRLKLTVCYPHEAEPAIGFISILSPVGRSLLGLRLGAVARWQTPSGEEGAAKVIAVLFQPEASGDYVR